MTVVRIVKDWDWPDLLRQTPGQQGVWEGIQFTVKPADDCDYLVMLNNRMKEDVHVNCSKENIWSLMQEPYVRGFNDWMVEGLDSFSKVYTHYIPKKNRKFFRSHPAIPWHVNKNYDQLIVCPVPEKSRDLSWIVGNACDLPGHIKRMVFLRFLQKEYASDIDLFGRAVHYIEDKWDGLASYRYSLAVENSSGPNYWTEKIGDCFLAWTVPFYYGCTNIEDYFPANSFVRIDINKPRESLELIKKTIQEDDWEKRIPALEEARNKLLHEYQLFPHLTKLVRSERNQNRSQSFVKIPMYQRSRETRILRAYYKIKRFFLKIYYL